MKTFNVLIVGAGNIGAFFDSPSSDNVVTHAHAFYRHDGFRIVGFTDVDEHKSREAAALWGGKSFSSIENAFEKEHIDIVSIAVPDDVHYEVFQELNHYPVKLIFAEKPLAKTLKQAGEIFSLYKKKQVPVLVNYTRRFVPEIIKIKEDIEKDLYGRYLSGTGYYGKGALHNGSHLVDLVRYCIGEISTVHPVDRFHDHYQDDPSVAAVLTISDNKPFFLQYVNCNLYTIFELDMLFEKKRITFKNSGLTIEEYDVHDDPIFNGYRNIVKTKESNTMLRKAAYLSAVNIYNHLTTSEALRCSLSDAYETMKACMAIRDGNG